jgi:hypothetical protein
MRQYGVRSLGTLSVHQSNANYLHIWLKTNKTSSVKCKHSSHHPVTFNGLFHPQQLNCVLRIHYSRIHNTETTNVIEHGNRTQPTVTKTALPISMLLTHCQEGNSSSSITTTEEPQFNYRAGRRGYLSHPPGQDIVWVASKLLSSDYNVYGG